MMGMGAPRPPAASALQVAGRGDDRAAGSARVGAAWVLSIAVHAVAAFAAIGVVTWLQADEAPTRAAPSEPDDETFVLELPAFDEPTTRANDAHVRTPEEAPEPPKSGGPVDPRPDTGRKGRGGEATSRATAVNLADRDDRVHLERSILSRLDRDQLARLKSGSERRSWEDWRASREPTELTFLAMGVLEPRDPERVADAKFDPGEGTRRSSPRTAEGGESVGDDGRLADPDGDAVAEARGAADGSRRGAEREGDERASHGIGWPSKEVAARETEAGRAAHARPMVDRSDPSIPAARQDLPSDTVDAEQEVASMVQSIVHASTAGGPKGTGKGGAADGGRWTGSGGTRGSGSVSSSLGTGGPGPAMASAADPARQAYLRKVMTKVHPLWANAFPKWAIAEGKQGTAIISFTIEADGTVSSASVATTSGVPEFDANVRAAVLRGAPYGPLPASLGPRLRWSMPFVAKNEAVRPKDPGDGITPR
jgi:TonB family protein